MVEDSIVSKVTQFISILIKKFIVRFILIS